jgi:putative spermidine/putrescine transport system ATP-binding protein
VTPGGHPRGGHPTGGSPGGAIQLRHVAKRYGEARALDDINLTVRRGEFLTLLGPSGSGKTTLLNVVAGFEDPDNGSVWFGERDISGLPPHRRDIGLVFQSLALFPHMSVRDNIAYPLKLRRLARAAVESKVEEALALVRLDGLKHRRIDELSGGQKQRVAIARAIVFDPLLLLMDEPLSALDKNLREEMQIEIRQLHDKLGTTTIYVTHDQREALVLSDRVAILNKGRLVQIDSPEAVHERPNSWFVANFIGQSYFLPLARDADRLLCGSSTVHAAQRIPEASELVLVVRPEKLFPVAEGAGAAGTVLSMRVTTCAYQGDSELVLGTTDQGHRIGFRRPWRMARLEPLAAGDDIRLGLHPNDVLVLPKDGMPAAWSPP